MKVKLELDLTPKEFRQAVGLPDIAGIQTDIIDAVKQQMQDGAEGFDPMSLFKSLISQSLGTAGEIQRMAERFMTTATKKRDDDNE